MRYRTIKLSKLEPAARDCIYWDSRLTLGQHASGEEGRHYLTVQRGLDAETIGRFRLGFVPFGVNVHPASYFAGRVIFPIFDAYDDLIAISARPVRDDWEADQKYWNESFSKGEHLYGLNQAIASIAFSQFAIIVEGQVDVLRMHSFGLTNTVGMLGGAFTPIQANILLRYTKNIVFVMDGDKGGRAHAAAARKLLETYVRNAMGRKIEQENHIRYAFASLQEGMDPDTMLARFGGQAMREEILSSMTVSGIKVPDKWQKTKKTTTPS